MNNRIKRYVIAILAACAVITVSCATSTTQSTASTRSSGSQTNAIVNNRQSIYMAHLREEGYTPSIDDDGDITFKREGLTYFIIIDSDDPTLFFLLLPSIKYLNSDDERRRAANAISAINRGVKVAKAFITSLQDRAWVTISVEVFLENPDHFAVIFGRLMRATILAEEIFDENF